MENFFATCPKGLEDLLAQELTELKLFDIKKTVAGVSFNGDLRGGYKAALWSRFASRILMKVSSYEAKDDLSLYLGAVSISWEKFFHPGKLIAVDFSGVSESIKNTLYGAQKIKDAIVDRFVKQGLPRPSVDVKNPDVRIAVHLDRKQKVSVSIDITGESLHRRSYRTKAGAAPLKENLAAAIVARSNLTSKSYVDPMCGSGTLLIEAAMRLGNVAPGLFREKLGFSNLTMHQDNVWQEVLNDAKKKAEEGKNRLRMEGFSFHGFDEDYRVIEVARQNADRAGLTEFIDFEPCHLKDLKNPASNTQTTVLTNPPYGERLGNFTELLSLYTDLGNKLRSEFPGSFASVISSSADLLSCIRLRSDKEFHLYNGALQCLLRNYSIYDAQSSVNKTSEDSSKSLEVAVDFANRLKKNIRNLRKYIDKENLEAYRIYDADLPNYNAAIDVYCDYAVIQEYAAPKQIPFSTTHKRLLDMMQVTQQVLGFPGDHIILKVRDRQRGTSQYEKLENEQNTITVKEYGAKYIVNLEDYLDTGLFSDHRLVRSLIRTQVKGKSFLNLFAYTGTASVQAALGGASSVTTVDMSRTYLNWAKDNLRINNFYVRAPYYFIQADCLKWIKESEETFDYIYIDPPTFSNSKRMDVSFDVQRDHVDLLLSLKKLLNPGGTILFSNNRRNFKLDEEKLKEQGFAIKNISKMTLCKDYTSAASLHNCWLLSLGEQS